MESKPSVSAIHLCRSCAPVLLGVKPAAFVCLTESEKRILERAACITPVRYEPVGAVMPRHVFLYIPELIERIMRQPGTMYTLQQLGYCGNTVEAYVAVLVERVRYSRLYDDLFPHEMGIFLGFPLEDVIGFWMHKGRGARTEGPWKVYGDIDEAAGLWQWHQKARCVMETALDAGMTMEEILMLYWNSKNRAYLLDGQ